ncbi:MAG: hypothetical protein DI573_01885 [Microbacterium sp.]|uniref:hypothetical protein n=1 Tax=Microbacterium sp. TaxID=51671 RepID=UPI000DB4193F|nr:hypothetical protein [Microbacterium sp.]PZU41173.1 MAG: hypothetical protein DI573_01885 [Microbacterium sp.]
MATSAIPVAPPDKSVRPVGAVTVASAPAGHPFVARITAAPGISLLPDPPVPGAPAGVWWPPAVLDPVWIARNASSAQLLHIHFGTESYSAGELAAAIDAAHDAGWPVVFTVHDLDHPQLGDQTRYAEQLDVLVGGADAVITLTPGAASAIAGRWNRECLVIPHPSMVAPDALPPRVRTSDETLMGVHLKDIRPNVDGPGTVRTLLQAAAELRSHGVHARVEVRLHHGVRDEDSRREVRRLCAKDDHATLVEHERLSDAELDVALSRLDVAVLPYRHGTHSGWLELCWDLGVPVVAPAVGFYAEQHPDDSVASYAPGDVAGLAAALTALLGDADANRAGSPARTDLRIARRARRRASDAAAAETHAALYRRLLANGSVA